MTGAESQDSRESKQHKLARRQQQMQDLFQAGADALRRALSDAFWQAHPELQATYLCPLCSERFWDRSALAGPHDVGLDLDEAPPRSMKGADGRVRVLTCRRCNNQAGSLLEDDLSRYWRQLDFVEGRIGPAHTAQLGIGGESINVVARFEPKSVDSHAAFSLVLLGGKPGQYNSPEQQRRVSHALDEIRRQGLWHQTAFSVTPSRGFRHDHALMALLKSAYLIAFARYGYRWALSRPVTPLRRALRLAVMEGKVQPASGPWALFSPGESRSVVRVGRTDTPEPIVVVQLGRHSVLLPEWRTEEGLYERLRPEGEQRTMTVGGVGWEPLPSVPEYLLDLT